MIWPLGHLHPLHHTPDMIKPTPLAMCDVTTADTANADMAVGDADAATAIADASPSPKKRRKRTSPGELMREKHRSAATRHHRTSSEAIAERGRWTGGWSGGWECDGRAGRGGWREFMAFDALHA